MLNSKTILMIGQNMFFVPRVENAAGPSGYRVKLTSTAGSFWETYDEGGIALVLVDLEGDRAAWSEVVQGLRERGSGQCRVVAFGPHSDVESLELAARLGCDAVLTKGAFSGAIGRIVETEGASAVPSKKE